VAEILAHLSHSEGHHYRMRVDRFLSEERPEFETDHANSHLERYRDADPEFEFDHFEERRDDNVEFLRSLPPAPGARVALDREAGEITLAQLLHEWRCMTWAHKAGSRARRARKYLAGAGPLGKDYRLNP